MLLTLRVCEAPTLPQKKKNSKFAADCKNYWQTTDPVEIARLEEERKKELRRYENSIRADGSLTNSPTGASSSDGCVQTDRDLDLDQASGVYSYNPDFPDNYIDTTDM